MKAIVISAVLACAVAMHAHAQEKEADLGIGAALGFTTPVNGLVLASTVSYQFSGIRLAAQLERVRKPAEDDYEPDVPVNCDFYPDPRACGKAYFSAGIEALAILGRFAVGPGVRWADREIEGRGTEPYGTLWVHLPAPYLTDENPHNGFLLRVSVGEVYRQLSFGIYLMQWW